MRATEGNLVIFIPQAPSTNFSCVTQITLSGGLIYDGELIVLHSRFCCIGVVRKEVGHRVSLFHHPPWI